MTHFPKRYKKAVVNLIYAGVLLSLCIFAVPRLILFFMPFVAGWLIAAIANPFVRFFEEKFKIRRKTGSAFVIIVVLALVILLLYFCASRLIQEGIGFVGTLPGLWEKTEASFGEIAKNMSSVYDRLPLGIKEGFSGMGEKMDGVISNIVGSFGTPTVNAVSRVAKNLPGILIGLIVSVLSSYFFVAEKEYINTVWERYVPESVCQKWNLVKSGLKNAVGGYFKAQFKIECWIFLLLVVGFLLLGIPYSVLVALLVAFLDFLPFFGTGLVMIPWAVVSFLTADYRMAVWLLIIWSLGQLIRQIIQPKIMGDSVGIAPLPTLFLLFIGYRAAGVAGMIFAVPIGIIVLNLYENGVFDTIKRSILILAEGFNRFRKLDEEDMEGIRDWPEDKK